MTITMIRFNGIDDNGNRDDGYDDSDNDDE